MDDRKLKVLAAVVDEYIRTGEPVGSKAIMSYIRASSATIRNEMAELEKQGYLEQPHTSAGRVPTYAGYRLYVDRLMRTDPLSDEEKHRLDGVFSADEYSEERLVKSVSNALAQITSCAAFVSSENPKFSVISKVEVIPTGKRLYVLLMITSSGKIKNRTCRLELDLTNEQLEYFTNFVKQNLEGVPLDVLSDEMLQKIETAMGTYLVVMSPLVKGIFDMSKEITEREVDVSGAKNLLECKDIDNHELMSFMVENPENLPVPAEGSHMQILIGPENVNEALKDTSVVVASYDIGDNMRGLVGVVGPTRMDYATVAARLSYFAEGLTKMFGKQEKESLPPGPKEDTKE